MCYSYHDTAHATPRVVLLASVAAVDAFVPMLIAQKMLRSQQARNGVIVVDSYSACIYIKLVQSCC